jgi:hypothetical protein
MRARITVRAERDKCQGMPVAVRLRWSCFGSDMRGKTRALAPILA